MYIRLLTGRAIVLNNTIQTLAENVPLELTLRSDIAYDDIYAICVLNSKRRTYKFFDGSVSIPPSELSSGELLITLQQIKEGKVLNTWYCEKITLREAPGRYEAIPEVLVLRKEIEEIRKVLEETKEYYKGICQGYAII